MSFSFLDRKENLKKAPIKKYDLIIVGGGITGAGVARDAASRGMSVALFEARDFAEGTSSRSSKLIHGGIRYLENFEFGLVFEALAERALLFKLAPHLVHPLRFLIPIYKSSRVGYWKMLAGMWLYDLLALMDTPQMHESLNSEETTERIPSLNARELTGAMEYSDAYTDDDRLVIETLRDAARRGAQLFNYCSVEKVSHKKGVQIQVKDQITGEEVQVEGKHLLTGVGPWTDLFGKKIASDWKEKLRPTKGVHLVFKKERVPVEKAIVMAVEKRIIFVIPRHEMVIVGTTDTDFKSDPVDVGTDKEDVAYLLGALNQYFPKLKVEEKDIVSSYAGIRPLVDDGSSTEGKTSREHSIWNHGENITCVAGGKYTTYRKISEEVVDHVLKSFPFDEKMSFGECKTHEPLNNKVSEVLYERDLQKLENNQFNSSLPKKLQESLVHRHGGEAQEIMDLISEKYEHYPAEESLWMGEADFAIQQTMCLSIKDFYWRRSPLFLSRADHGLPLLNGIAQVFKEFYGWDEATLESQKQQVHEQIKKDLSWKS